MVDLSKQASIPEVVIYWNEDDDFMWPGWVAKDTETGYTWPVDGEFDADVEQLGRNALFWAVRRYDGAVMVKVIRDSDYIFIPSMPGGMQKSENSEDLLFDFSMLEPISKG